MSLKGACSLGAQKSLQTSSQTSQFLHLKRDNKLAQSEHHSRAKNRHLFAMLGAPTACLRPALRARLQSVHLWALLSRSLALVSLALALVLPHYAHSMESDERRQFVSHLVWLHRPARARLNWNCRRLGLDCGARDHQKGNSRPPLSKSTRVSTRRVDTPSGRFAARWAWPNLWGQQIYDPAASWRKAPNRPASMGTSKAARGRCGGTGRRQWAHCAHWPPKVR